MGRIERKAKTNKINILFKRPGPLEVEPFSEHFKITFYRLSGDFKGFFQKARNSFTQGKSFTHQTKEKLTHAFTTWGGVGGSKAKIWRREIKGNPRPNKAVLFIFDFSEIS